MIQKVLLLSIIIAANPLAAGQLWTKDRLKKAAEIVDCGKCDETMVKARSFVALSAAAGYYSPYCIKSQTGKSVAQDCKDRAQEMATTVENDYFKNPSHSAAYSTLIAAREWEEDIYARRQSRGSGYTRNPGIIAVAHMGYEIVDLFDKSEIPTQK